MKRAGLEEQDAFRRLQLLSSEKNKKMVEIAQMIVTAEEAMCNFGPLAWERPMVDRRNLSDLSRAASACTTIPTARSDSRGSRSLG